MLIHRRVNQIPQQVADVFALAGSLHHEHGEQVLGGIDEEERAGHAAPEELPSRAEERSHAGVGPDGKSQAEMNIADAYRYAAEVMTENMMARDAEEGICAFIEKRTPTWEDR